MVVAIRVDLAQELNYFQVAWVRVDTQTILSIHHNIITQNPRISLSYNDHRSWYLHIKSVQEVDRGWYMCQVNTDPMRSRKGYLQVVVNNLHHHHVSRKTSTVGYRHGKALHSDQSCAFYIHRDPAILTRSLLHLVGGLRQLVSRSADVIREPSNPIGHQSCEQSAPPIANSVSNSSSYVSDLSSTADIIIFDSHIER
ncbi:hypothetical protein MSG28_008081 [Choristoneura fumiferana]|uniref:Uncharacterized protein n=1 Tax=Choristoneura fumiferana TaxID=7141 RepID=A0ACC0JA69_CHOFU|nr:hypothetical protein MSG28_008081 [Choristoneura fumiferana]